MTGSILQVAPGNNQIPNKTPKMVMQNQKKEFGL